MGDLKAKLMEQARGLGICGAGFSEMRSLGEDALIDYYLRNPDWCMERDYPTLGFLRENFSASKLEEKGIFIDRTFRGEVLNDRQVYVFHNCKGTVKTGLNVEKQLIPMMYLANGCLMRFVGVGDVKPRRKEDRTKVPLYLFDMNTISARDNIFVKFVRHYHELILP